jgi:TfoX/Sxy family transcriptional regulator of competence genes
MASKKETFDYVLGQLAGIEGISSRQMMGEYLIYFQGKVVAGIYDDRFLVKKTKGSIALLPGVLEEIPYEGAKPMLSMSDIIFDGHSDNTKLIGKVFNAISMDILSIKPIRKR